MRLAIVHYHLDPGGVSRVIAAASRALDGAGIRHVILTGPPAERQEPALPVTEVPGLGYAGAGHPAITADALRDAAATALGGPPDLWHFHNHALGKNPALTDVVAELAGTGERLLLQIHDLAEDGRPGNAAALSGCPNHYPLAAHVHYAFLNSRDLSRFTGAGLPEENAHLLGNPCGFSPAPACPESAAPLLLYPVRAIRRKNIGELLLLTMLAPAGSRAAITRAPLAPEWRPIHDDWRDFSRELGLPLDFAVVDRRAPAPGAGNSLDEWIAHATHLVTTSVAEGFGMVHAEALALGKPLLGRTLPPIEADLAAAEVQHGDFYQSLRIPASWVDRETLRSRAAAAIAETWRAWRRSPPTDAAEHAGFTGNPSDGLDFGNLPELIQQRVLRDIAASPETMLPQVTAGRGGGAVPASTWLAAALAVRRCPADARALRYFSIPVYRERLEAIYQKLTNSPVGKAGALDAGRVLDACLAPGSFRFLTSPGIETRPEADFGVMSGFKALVFDIYGTLRLAPAGGVKPDPDADPLLRKVLTIFGCRVPDSPSAAIHAAVRRRHAESPHEFPEVDLRELWREVAALPDHVDPDELVIAIESVWRPSSWIPGAEHTLWRLHALGIPLGILSNAQCDMLPSLGRTAELFSTDLTVLSYQHRIAKPSAGLFDLMVARLEKRGISPGETLYIGNDPRHDIAPAAHRGFRTAWFTGHPDSHRPGYHPADFILRRWPA